LNGTRQNARIVNTSIATARLFIGVWPAPETLRGLEACRNACQWPAGARPTPTANMHLTLHFIGQVERAAVPALVEALKGSCPRTTLSFSDAAIDVWPDGVAVLLPAKVPEPLLDLHARLGKALQSRGHVVEQRPWRPHITLARRAVGAVVPAPPLGSLVPADWPVCSYALAESRGGYHLLHRFNAAA
jgi:2'-5' RNA ligase